MRIAWSLLLIAASALAEKLSLRDGTQIGGAIESMDAAQVRIRRCGRIETYSRSEIVSIELAASAESGDCRGTKWEIPERTTLSLLLLDYIDSNREPRNQTFRALLDAPLIVDGKEIVPKGFGATLQFVERGRELTLEIVGLQLDRKRWAEVRAKSGDRLTKVAVVTAVGDEPIAVGGARVFVPSKTVLRFSFLIAAKLIPPKE
ncbi:MAG TPA: hypothetical protein VKE70_25520 [Candidatus Solibacter sp.]|nr:hypothetical protein [Candidatus Solibacter sp.]